MHLLTSFFLAVGIAASPAPAGVLLANGDFDRAKAAYAQEVAANAGDAEARLALARIALYENRLDDADRNARAVKDAAPERALVAQRVIDTVAQRRAILSSAAALNVPSEGVVVPFLAVDPLPLLQLDVAGHIANLVLDTGGPDVVLDPAFASELGLQVSDGPTGTFAGGRTARVRQTVIPELRVGPLVLRDIKAGVLPSRRLPFFGARKVDGVIGTVFLSRFLSTIDYPQRRLVLRPRNGEAARGTAMPMWLVADHFIFARGSVNGVQDQLFLIDSGLAGGGFAPEPRTIATAHLKTFPEKAQTGMGGGGDVKFIPVVADRLCLASECRNDVQGMYTPEGSPLTSFPFAVSGAVSHAFLEHYAVTFDFSSMKLTLSP